MSPANPQTVTVHRRVEVSAAALPMHAVDIHCHCLPGFDDGPGSMAEALQLCAACAADGIGAIIATPHQLGRYDGRTSAGDIRRAVAGLRMALAGEGIPLRVLPGADVRLDDRLVERIVADEVMTLGDGGKYLLLELPHSVPIDPLRLFQELRARGITVILSHPERYEYLSSRLDWMLRWLGEGVAFQVTAGSLIGQFGSGAERTAWSLLEQGWAGIVASDAHDCIERPPVVGAAMREIGKRLGASVGQRVCADNPRRIVEGSSLLRMSDPSGGWEAIGGKACRPAPTD